MATAEETADLGYPAPASRHQPLLVTAGWWAATLVTLVVLDDLTFGPVFWLVSVFGSPQVGFAVAFVVYVVAQVALVRAATSEQPHRVASFFLRRLDLARRSTEIDQREQRLWARVTGSISAMAMAVLVGGVLPPIVLWRQGWSARQSRQLSVATSTVYALEFALIHGWFPGTL